MNKFKSKSIVSLVENYRLPYGQYRRCLLQEVEDIDYLEWLEKNAHDRLDRVIIKTYLQAWRDFSEEKPDHIPDEQLTKFIMMKKQKLKEEEGTLSYSENQMQDNS